MYICLFRDSKAFFLLPLTPNIPLPNMRMGSKLLRTNISPHGQIQADPDKGKLFRAFPSAAWRSSAPWAGTALQLLFSSSIAPCSPYQCNNHTYPAALPLVRMCWRTNLENLKPIFPAAGPTVLSILSLWHCPVETYRNSSASGLTRNVSNDLLSEEKRKYHSIDEQQFSCSLTGLGKQCWKSNSTWCYYEVKGSRPGPAKNNYYWVVK